jgi:hypothetical protein
MSDYSQCAIPPSPRRMLIIGLLGAIGGLTLFGVSVLMLTSLGPGSGMVAGGMVLITVAVILLSSAASVLTGVWFGRTRTTHVVTAGLWFVFGALTLIVVIKGINGRSSPWTLTAFLPLATVVTLITIAVMALFLMRKPAEPTDRSVTADAAGPPP